MSTLRHDPAATAAAPSAPAASKPAHSDHPSTVAKGKFNPRELDWVVIVGLIFLHGAAAFAFIPSLFTWSGLVLAFVFAFIATCLGMCVCYHRLLSHRSFRTPKWFEYVLVWCGCLAWQGGPVGWVGTHRLHHKHSDGDHDPHTPQHGFTWAHITWFMHKYHHGVERRQAATDLLKDRGLRFLDTYAWLPLVVLIAALFGAGYAWGTWVSDMNGLQVGLSWVVWAVALRTVVFFHITWFVNSASHTWGYQNYKDSGDHSTNLWWLALPSFGEGWHNNHHANPRSAAHGLRWWEFDITYTVIKMLSWVGLASRLNVPPTERRPWKKTA